jgi:hypothetical protein
VASDALAAGRLAAEHLLGLGHSRLAFVGPAADVHAFRQRERGFVQALRAAGVALPSAWLRRAPATAAGGMRAMRALLAERPRPTAVFCANDLAAVGALKACAAAGVRVPAELSLVGCDDVELASLVSPELTTVRVPARELGARAARLLVQRLAAPAPGAPGAPGGGRATAGRAGRARRRPARSPCASSRGAPPRAWRPRDRAGARRARRRDHRHGQLRAGARGHQRGALRRPRHRRRPVRARHVRHRRAAVVRRRRVHGRPRRGRGAARARRRGRGARDLDLLVVATDTPEYVSPATSSVVQGRLGALRAGTFDVNSGCAGFATALDVAWKYVRADERYGRVLVVGAYAMSKFLDRATRRPRPSSPTARAPWCSRRSRAARPTPRRAACSPPSCTPTGASRRGWACSPAAPPSRSPRPCSATATATGCASSRSTPASVNEEGWPRIARSVLARAGAAPAEVDLWLWTQVNRSTIESVMGTLGQPMARAHTVMEKWGYTGSACLPMALDDAARAGRLAPGDLVLLTGSGAGLSMASVALRWALPRRAGDEGDARA